jgi:hypothetical protein
MMFKSRLKGENAVSGPPFLPRAKGKEITNHDLRTITLAKSCTLNGSVGKLAYSNY